MLSTWFLLLLAVFLQVIELKYMCTPEASLHMAEWVSDEHTGPALCHLVHTVQCRRSIYNVWSITHKSLYCTVWMSCSTYMQTSYQPCFHALLPANYMRTCSRLARHSLSHSLRVDLGAPSLTSEHINQSIQAMPPPQALTLSTLKAYKYMGFWAFQVFADFIFDKLPLLWQSFFMTYKLPSDFSPCIRYVLIDMR